MIDFIDNGWFLKPYFNDLPIIKRKTPLYSRVSKLYSFTIIPSPNS